MGYFLRQCRPLRRGGEVMALGEGIETMLSLRCVLPTMLMAAALSAAPPLLLFPDALRRLYIARDDDPAGDGALAMLLDRNEGRDRGDRLVATTRDFNEDLRRSRADALRAALRIQLAPRDVARFMELAHDL